MSDTFLEHWYSEAVSHIATCITNLLWASWGAVMLEYFLGSLIILHVDNRKLWLMRRLEARLCLLYRIIHNLCYFDSSVFALSTFCSHRRFHPLFLKHAHPFAHTNSYFYSFVPHTITLWNSLNTTTVTAPSLATFRNSLNYSLYL